MSPRTVRCWNTTVLPSGDTSWTNWSGPAGSSSSSTPVARSLRNRCGGPPRAAENTTALPSGAHAPATSALRVGGQPRLGPAAEVDRPQVERAELPAAARSNRTLRPSGEILHPVVVRGDADAPELPAGSVDPRESRPIVARLVGEDTVRRRRERRPRRREEVPYRLGDREGLARHAAAGKVESLAEQGALPDEDEVAGIDVLHARNDRQDGAGRLSGLRQHQLAAPVAKAGEIEEPLPIGQERRPVDPGVSLRRIRPDRHHRRPARGRHTVDRFALRRGEEDLAVCPPRPVQPDARAHVAQGKGRTSRKVEALQLAAREEGEGPAVGRPE